MGKQGRGDERLLGGKRERFGWGWGGEFVFGGVFFEAMRSRCVDLGGDQLQNDPRVSRWICEIRKLQTNLNTGFMSASYSPYLVVRMSARL